MTANPSAQWEHLREDLILLPGPSMPSGAPSWTLQDPAAGTFYRIGWLEFEILKRWNTANPVKIIQDIIAHTTLRPGEKDVSAIYAFLKSACLLQAKTPQDTQHLLKIKTAHSQKNWFKALLKNYLFFRIPLVKPDKLLSALKPISDKLFRPIILKLILIFACIGAYLVLRDLDEFIAGFKILQSPSGLLAGFFTLAFAKIIHELGHALTCKYYGCRVPAMGIAFIVLWPLLWTDTTDAWRLTDRKKRLTIDGAGMIAELSLAAIASILWAIAPEGTFKDAMHLLAGVTWLMTLFVNLNPLMRFDGYYLLSDLLDIPNLQERSFKLAKHKMRKVLWDIDEQKSEHFSPKTENWLIFYAYCVWIYRFFLFLGIALLVYHLFFKALGLFLMIVELWWFIARPITSETLYWVKNRNKMNIHSNKKALYAACLTLIVAAIFIPWQNKIAAPAILKSAQEIPLFTSSGGLLTHINISSGQTIQEGETAFILENQDLLFDIKRIEQKKNILQKDLSNKSVDQDYYREASLINEKLNEQQANLDLKQAKRKELIITAPIDGVISDIPSTLKTGAWAQEKEFLGIIRSETYQIEAFVPETQLARINTGNSALFYPNGAFSPLKGTIARIDTSAVKSLPYPELGSDFGGQIIIRTNAKNGPSGPKEQLYKVTIALEKPANIENTALGKAYITSERESLFTKFYRKALSIIIQESGL